MCFVYGFCPLLGDVSPGLIFPLFLSSIHTPLLHRPVLVSALWPPSCLPHLWMLVNPLAPWNADCHWSFSRILHLCFPPLLILLISLILCLYQRSDGQNWWKRPKLSAVLQSASLAISLQSTYQLQVKWWVWCNWRMTDPCSPLNFMLTYLLNMTLDTANWQNMLVFSLNSWNYAFFNWRFGEGEIINLLKGWRDWLLIWNLYFWILCLNIVVWLGDIL